MNKCLFFISSIVRNDTFRCKTMHPGQRLQGFAQNWKNLSASRKVLGLVKAGYKMKFAVQPKLSKPLKKFETNLPEDQMKVVRAEVTGFLAKKAIRIVSKNEAEKSLGFYSKLFCVPKPGDNNWRMIIDMRRLMNVVYFQHNFIFLLD